MGQTTWTMTQIYRKAEIAFQEKWASKHDGMGHMLDMSEVRLIVGENGDRTRVWALGDCLCGGVLDAYAEVTSEPEYTYIFFSSFGMLSSDAEPAGEIRAANTCIRVNRATGEVDEWDQDPSGTGKWERVRRHGA